MIRREDVLFLKRSQRDGNKPFLLIIRIFESSGPCYNRPSVLRRMLPLFRVRKCRESEDLLFFFLLYVCVVWSFRIVSFGRYSGAEDIVTRQQLPLTSLSKLLTFLCSSLQSRYKSWLRGERGRRYFGVVPKVLRFREGKELSRLYSVFYYFKLWCEG